MKHPSFYTDLKNGHLAFENNFFKSASKKVLPKNRFSWDLKVLSNGKEGEVWVVTIGWPLNNQLSVDFKNCLKDPFPLNSKKRCWATLGGASLNQTILYGMV